MKNAIFIAPAGKEVGLTSTCLGLVRAFDKHGVSVSFFKPITQTENNKIDPSYSLLNTTMGLAITPPITLDDAQNYLAQNEADALLERIVEHYEIAAEHADVIIIEGLVADGDSQYIGRLNRLISEALDCQVILVSAKGKRTLAQMNERITSSLGMFNANQIIGCIVNKMGAPVTNGLHLDASRDKTQTEKTYTLEKIYNNLTALSPSKLRCIGAIHWQAQLMAPRTADVAEYLQAKTINEGEAKVRRVSQLTICARTMPNMLHTLVAGTLIVIPADRNDIFMAACMAAFNDVPLAGILLVGDGFELDPRVYGLCAKAIHDKQLPVMTTQGNTISTAQSLQQMSNKIPANDTERAEKVMDYVADNIDIAWLQQKTTIARPTRLSPPAFRHNLVKMASKFKKRIVLPEGAEPRTIQAALICQQKNIADCILLGDKDEILRVSESLGLTLPSEVEIIDPIDVRHKYIPLLMEMRKHREITAKMASAQLEDNVMLGTLMLANNEVDGLVSGAIHTTANTIRPALQLIKTAPESDLVSSVFFMCLPEQVVVYGDCAVNPDPTAEQLADIAIQSNDSAKAFGIEPRIAMISYSTGQSGSGADVDKVREATRIAKEKRPDLIIDGPLQYDAASVQSVANQKAPDSPVAGKATVFVFPDLNTGNTTYKAVQRSAKVVSMGPMLQGLNKPVNDLSRGGLIDDIVYTIALTSIQATQRNTLS